MAIRESQMPAPLRWSKESYREMDHVGWFSFGPVFAVSAAAALVAFLLTLRVTEPRHINRLVTLEGHSL